MYLYIFYRQDILFLLETIKNLQYKDDDVKKTDFFKTGPVWIFTATLFLLLAGTIGTEITQMNVRFALMIDEITRRGTGMFAALNGIPYLDYFSGWLLCAWMTSLCGRAVTLAGMALPAILLGAYTAVMVYLIGERVRKGVGLGAVMLLFISPEFAFLFTGLGIDVPVMAIGVTMLYLMQRRNVSQLQFFGVFFLLLLAGFVLRGPLGIILPGAGVCGFLLASRKWTRFTAAGFTCAIAGIICLSGCVGLILLTGGRELWDWFVQSQFLERVAQKRTGLNIFFDACAAMSPAALLSLGIFLHSRRRILSRPAIGWIGFLGLPLLLMMFPSRVHTRYLAILFPAWALLGSYVWSCGRPGRWFQALRRRVERPLDRWYRPLSWLLILVLAAIGVFMTGAANQPWGHYLAAGLLVAAIPLWTDETMHPFRPLLAAGIVLAVAFNPFIAADENSRNFTAAVESVRTGRLWLLELGPDHDDLKYLLHVDPAKRAGVRYVFFEPPCLSGMYAPMYRVEELEKVLPEIAENDVIVLRRRKFELDNLRSAAEKHHRTLVPAASGTLGHRECIAVRLTAAK